MSRYRRVPAVDIQEQKKTILQKNLKKNSLLHPPGLFAPGVKSGTPLNSTKMNPKDFLLEVCMNLKGVCNNVRNFTAEMDNLLNSVENILPVVETVATGYARSLKSKETEAKTQSENKNDTSSLKPDSNKNESFEEEKQLEVENSAKSVSEKLSSGQPPSSLPSEEEIKAFLNNPLVISLMQTLTEKLKSQK